MDDAHGEATSLGLGASLGNVFPASTELVAQSRASGAEHHLGGGWVDAEILYELIKRHTIRQPIEQLLHR